MSNRFYSFLNALISGSVAKSSEVNAQFSAIDAGMTLLEGEANRAIKFPAAEASTNQIISNVAAARQGYMLGFDTSGNLTVTNKFLVDWSMDSKRLRNLPSAVASDEPVTLGQLGTYSSSLIAGFPSIVAQNGPLVTNGSTVTWGISTQLVPSITSQKPSSYLILSGGTTKWSLSGHNLSYDPNGSQGSAYWTTSLNNVEDVTGYHWRNNGVLAAATFDHKPSALGYSACAAALPVTAAVTVNTAGASAGTISLVLRYYDAGLAFLSESTAVAVTMALATDTRYVINATTPATTAYVQPWLKFAGVSASASGVKVRDLKLETGSDSTPFNDDKTNALLAAAKAANPFGFGFATPIITLGDATATTAQYDMRSQTGAQAYDVRIKSTGGTNGTVGKGTLSIEARAVISTGPIGYASEYNAGNAGAGITIDFLNGPKQKVTMNAATPVLTISAAPVVGHYQIKLIQDPATLRVPSWVGFVAGDCVGNAFPTISQTLSGVTFIYLYWDGTQYWVSGNVWD